MSDREAREERSRELVRGNRARLRRIARAYGDDRHDAEDLHQEILPEDGATHTGDGDANADYHCFGQPVPGTENGRSTVGSQRGQLVRQGEGR